MRLSPFSSKWNTKEMWFTTSADVPRQQESCWCAKDVLYLHTCPSDTQIPCWGWWLPALLVLLSSWRFRAEMGSWCWWSTNATFGRRDGHYVIVWTVLSHENWSGMGLLWLLSQQCKELRFPKEEEGKGHIWNCSLSCGTKMGYHHLMTAVTAAQQPWDDHRGAD